MCTTGACLLLHTCVNVLQAGGLVSSCGRAGRRGHCLVGVQGRFLLLHGGYSGTCELLQDAWLYDTHRDVWLPVELTGRGRGQHTVLGVTLVLTDCGSASTRVTWQVPDKGPVLQSRGVSGTASDLNSQCRVLQVLPPLRPEPAGGQH